MNVVRSVLAGILVHQLLDHLVEALCLYFPAEESSSSTHPRQSQAVPTALNVSQRSVSRMIAIDKVICLPCSRIFARRIYVQRTPWTMLLTKLTMQQIMELVDPDANRGRRCCRLDVCLKIKQAVVDGGAMKFAWSRVEVGFPSTQNRDLKILVLDSSQLVFPIKAWARGKTSRFVPDAAATGEDCSRRQR